MKNRKFQVALALFATVLVVTLALFLRTAPPTPSLPTATSGLPIQGAKPNAPNTGPVIPASSDMSEPGQTTYPNGVTVIQDVKHDVSPPLRSIPPSPVQVQQAENENESPFPVPQTKVKDTVVQNFFGPLSMPAPILTFDGITQAQGCGGCLPPDTNGDVGPNHYVQSVNSAFGIWDKSGNVVLTPRNINTLFAGFGAPCQTTNAGDPIVLYDSMADRWLITQFTSSNPFGECLAVSSTPDPTGAYNRYFFQFSTTELFDYPHFGIWPDGYYMGANVFLSQSFQRPAAMVFDRVKMLAGLPATVQIFNPGNFYATLLPADLDGANLPPAGAPNPIVSTTGNINTIHLWHFHVDWTTPANSALLGPSNVPAAPWDPDLCGGGLCIPQPGTVRLLDTLGDHAMFRLQYRNFGSHETLVFNQSVDADSTDHSGIRWYELRDPNGSPFVYQQGTYAPDATHRWMGSAAMDRDGNIAIGYSASSTTITPSLRYAGRLATDPLGILAQGEMTMFQGNGSQTSTSGRWGDYSALTVDPSDDCTFWFTSEYLQTTSSASWRTRIGSFKFPGCGSTTPTPTVTGTPPTATNTPTSTPTASPVPASCANYGYTIGTGTFISATTLIGLQCDDCAIPITLPFPVKNYQDTYTTAVVSSNGVLEFGSGDYAFGNACLPVVVYDHSIAAFWDDLILTNAGEGVYTSTAGIAPNRTLLIEWRGRSIGITPNASVDFAIMLHENSANFEIYYSPNTAGLTRSSTIGVQNNTTYYTQYLCNTTFTSPRTKLSFTIEDCPTATPTRTNTSTSTPTPTRTNTNTPTNTPTPGPSFTPTVTLTRTSTNTQTPTNTPTATATCTGSYSTAVPWVTVAPALNDVFGAGGAGSDTNYYMGGGYSTNTFTYPSTFARYNPIANTWTSLASLTNPGEGMAFAYSPLTNKVYSFGGANCDTSTVYATTRIYDVGTNTWSTGAPMPTALHGMAVGYNDGKIYLAGGFTACTVTPVNTLYIYDIATNSWTSGATVTQALGGAGGAVINGRFYVAGGRDATSSNRTTLYEYTVATNTWATRAAMPSGINAPGSAASGNTLWIYGGGTPFLGNSSVKPLAGQGKAPNAPDAVTTTRIWNFDTNTWSVGPTLNVSRSFVAGGNVQANIIAAGGFDGTTTTNTTELAIAGGVCSGPTPTGTATSTPVATPTCSAGPAPWTAGAVYPTNVSRYGFARFGNTFYVLGGVVNGLNVTNVRRYDSVTNVWTNLAAMPFASEAPACAFMSGDLRIYCAQGDTGSGFGIYNTATNTWTTGPAVPGTDHYGAAAGAFGGKVYIVGGGFAGATTTVQVYDTASATWSTGISSPTAYELGGYTQVGQYLYTVGSFGSSALGMQDTLLRNASNASRAIAPNANSTSTYRLDMTTGAWSTGPVWTPARADFALAYDPVVNKLYAIGGDAPGGTFFDSSMLVDELSLASWPAGSWAASAPFLPTPRQANSAGSYTTGRAFGEIWSTGGVDATTATALTENIYRANGYPCPTITPTSTSTFTAVPTNTRTNTPTITPTATCVINANYTPTKTTGATITPGVNLVAGSQCTSCVVSVNLPFTYNFYDQNYTSVNVSNQGNLQFASSSTATGSCIPTTSANYVIAPYWGNLSTIVSPAMGVYTTVTGVAPNRVFIIEWRVQRVATTKLSLSNFEVLLYEGIPRFDFIYGNINDQGLTESIGAQESTGLGFRSVSWSCNSASIAPGDRITFDRRSCSSFFNTP